MAEAEREDAATATAAAMTLDEFKQGMFRSLRDSGTMELVRVRSLHPGKVPIKAANSLSTPHFLGLRRPS